MSMNTLPADLIRIPPTRTHRLREQFITRLITEVPAVMYDIGVGHKTEWWSLRDCWPNLRVFGAEPNPAMCNAIHRAGFPGPLAHVAIGEPEGPAILHLSSQNPGCSSLLPVSNNAIDVNVWSLDRFDRQMGQHDGILLWIDIEGSELDALRSGRRLLSSGRVRWINVEERLNGDRPAAGWCEPNKLHSFLTDLGFRRLAEYNQHSTHQDVVYVR